MVTPARQLADPLALLSPASVAALVEYAWELAREDHARRAPRPQAGQRDRDWERPS